MGKEIERKWMPEKLPDFIYNCRHEELVQGYMCTSPTVRIRKEEDKYFLTYKSPGGLERVEYNLPITRYAFEHMLPKCDGVIIIKERYYYSLPDSNLIAEADVFKETYEGRFYIEVEFDSVDAAEAFNAPQWFGREVTGLKEYSNAALALGAVEAKGLGTAGKV